VSALLCALFAVCTAVATVNDPPAWSDTAPVAVPLIEQWEGLPCDGDRCAAYLDAIASPPVWTICSGITGPGVGPGDVRTRAECRADLRRLVVGYWQGYRDALTPGGLAVLVVPVDAAFVSLTYNIGIGAVSGSTAVRRLNTGDVAGACEALTWWDRAGGRVIRGLVNRRAAEYRLCMAGAG
jgi:GH24 family phage-related lysozyme (muramidase)